MNHIKNRVLWLDELKGFTILMVVIGHVADMYYDRGLYKDYTGILIFLSNAVNTFMMPLFFLLSGCSFGKVYISERDKSVIEKDRVKRQIINLGIIYIIWSIILFLLKSIFSDDIISRVSYSTILLIPIKAISLYWYLYVLICCYILVLFIYLKQIDRKIIFGLSIVGCLLQYWITHGFIGNWTITRVPMYLSFFLGGIIFIRTEKIIKLISNYKSIISNLSSGILLMFLSWYVMFKDDDIRFVWSDIPIMGGIFSALICLGLVGVFIKFESILRVFKYIGIHSLEIYLLHRFSMMGMRVILRHLNMKGFYFPYIIVVCAATTIPLLLSLFAKKVKVYDLLFRPIAVVERNINLK